ncbi:hypothetical protein CASFOL_021729 [Castilleja foliolosa]|uniref:Jacalin-type lectin domain-containing protein n=1 Tax=Castilleja foliolosa TaxID=1961234 RepID=A0ABD3D153_9LAMI
MLRKDRRSFFDAGETKILVIVYNWDLEVKFSGSLGSITFGSNRDQYGPFGVHRGGRGEFNFQLSDQFGELYCHADSKVLKSIGVYLKPITTESSDVKLAKN